jgi:hypothetical protein
MTPEFLLTDWLTEDGKMRFSLESRHKKSWVKMSEKESQERKSQEEEDPEDKFIVFFPGL